MPDITMCGSEQCGLKETCYRNPASGTEPSEYRQSWFVEPPIKDNGFCHYYWETKKSGSERP